MKINHKGFTLVEMAVVLVIIGLMLGTILGMGNAQIQASKISSTKQKEQSIKLALINFISRNNRLPCPAIPTIAKGNVGYGMEAPNLGACTGTNISGTVSTGIVPWSSLGLSDENASDGYYNRFTYQVALAATNTNDQTIVGLRGTSSTHLATPATLRSPPNGNQTNDCNPNNNPYNPCSAVVVIISHGTNGSGAYTENGVQKALPNGNDEAENADNDSVFIIKDYSEVAENPFDDIVLALTSSDLLTPLTTNNSIPEVRASINQDVTDIKNAIIANSITNRVFIPASGTHSYPIANNLVNLNLPINSIIDPWANQYTYTLDVNAVNIVSSTNGNINAITLRSSGADATLNNNDDIVTIITVSQLQDAFAKVGW